MIDCTDQYFRQLIRIISHHAYLYTEMITTQAILKGEAARILAFEPCEHLVALQVGGSDPKELAQVAKIAEEQGYDEINLNVGCPSPRVQAGRFGACLMKEPQLVADCIASMQAVVNIPVTVKTRIGVDEFDSYQLFNQFIETVKTAPCHTFIVHARKAWLKGLSPKQNRTIPELKYDYVHQLKAAHPELEIIINGGITDLDEQNQFADLDGMMIGREAYGNPYHLINVDQRFYDDPHPVPSRQDVLMQFFPFAEQALARGFPVSILLKHVYGLSHGIAGGSYWRRQGSALLQSGDKVTASRLLQFFETFPQS